MTMSAMLADDEDEDGGGFIWRPSFPTVLEVNPVIDVPYPSLSFSPLSTAEGHIPQPCAGPPPPIQ